MGHIGYYLTSGIVVVFNGAAESSAYQINYFTSVIVLVFNGETGSQSSAHRVMFGLCYCRGLLLLQTVCVCVCVCMCAFIVEKRRKNAKIENKRKEQGTEKKKKTN